MGPIPPVVCVCARTSAQQPSSHASAAKPAILMTGLGNLHHPVSVGNPQAEQFFDQSLRAHLRLNRDEAARSFQCAADLDPKLAVSD